MNRLNRRRFMALSSAGVASAVLVACGNESASEADLNPTMIPDVAGAPPTLAPMSTPPQTSAGGGQASGEEQQGSGEQAAGGGTVEVSAVDIAFEPTEFDVAPGATIKLTNNGMLEHDLAVDDWGGVVIGPLNGGEAGEFTVPDDANPGDVIDFYCSIPGHKEAGMVGKLTIVEAGAAGGEEEASPEEGAAGGAIGEVKVSAIDIAFEPKEFDVSPGTKITLTNDGMLEHDLAVDAWGGVVIGPLNGGEAGEYTVPDDVQPGDTIDFYCSIPGHKEAGMVGTMTVVEASAGGAAEEATAEEASPEGEAAASPAGGADLSEVQVSGFEMGFDPSNFDVAPGTKITMTNDGMLEHDFAVDAWGGVIIGPLNGGESGEFTVPDDAQPGETLDFYCSIPGHKESGMVGKLTVVEAGGGQAAATPQASPAEDQDAAAGGAAEVQLSAIDIAFEPKDFEASAGTKIVVTNDGMLEHDFAVDAWGGVLVGPLSGGDSGEYTVPDDVNPGDVIDYYCSIPGHKEAGMVGTITIV